jgi:TolA-binding protein
VNWPTWLTPEKVLGIVGALLIAAVSGTFAIASLVQQNRVVDRDRMVEARDKEIESMQTAKSWNVPTTIDRLNDVSEKLQKQFASMEALETLRKENEDLRLERNSLAKTSEEIASKLMGVTEENTLLKSSMEKIFASNQTIELEAGKAVELVKNSLSLGISSVYSDSSISGRLGNERLSMAVGESKEIRVLGKDCRLTLTEARNPRVSFAFSCS